MTYTPRPGSVAELAIEHLEAHGPSSSRELADAADCDTALLFGSMVYPLRNGAVVRRNGAAGVIWRLPHQADPEGFVEAAEAPPPREIRESDIETHLVRSVKALGGEIRKVQWIGRRGAPDRMVLLPGRLTWVELKAPGVQAEDYQLREHARLRAMGQHVVVLDSIAGVDALLRRMVAG